ncbi:ABC transporter permease [Sporosarcina sp. FSL K6-3457]|uniref:ABC transporter permease n=1 Tax=Sporosarcina sp. FSL K6-3457 TaxID=2978204 RepID=UPI0040469F34
MKLLIEQWQSKYLVLRLAFFQVQSANRNNFLGVLWELLNPSIQIGMYWFVFGLGIRGNADVEGIPFVYWMLSGIVMWFFVNAAIIEGTKSIFQKHNLVAKMNFPLTAIPAYVVMSKFYVHIIMVSMIVIIFSVAGYIPSIYYIQLLYFMLMTYLLSFAVSLLGSTLAVLVRDVQMLVQAGLRILFFVSPILWLPDMLPQAVQKIIMLNPFYYLANGYRASLLYQEWYIIEQWPLTLYNIILVVGILSVGSFLHFKMRDRFADYI